jgi:hypothetical protein
MKRSLTLLAALSSACGGGAAATPQHADASAGDAPQAFLDQLGLRPTAMYSFGYSPQFPEQRAMRLSIFEPTRTEFTACEAYHDDTSNLAELWHLGVAFSGHAPGTYRVTTDPDWEASPNVVVVNLIRGAEIYSAVAGQVELVEAPEPEASASDGSRVSARLTVDFPRPLARTLSCSGGANVVTGEIDNSACDCEDQTGREFACVVDGGAGSCCASSASDSTFQLELDLDAGFCPFMCVFTDPTLAGRCAALYPIGN